MLKALCLRYQEDATCSTHALVKPLVAISDVVWEAMQSTQATRPRDKQFIGLTSYAWRREYRTLHQLLPHLALKSGPIASLLPRGPVPQVCLRIIVQDLVLISSYCPHLGSEHPSEDQPTVGSQDGWYDPWR